MRALDRPTFEATPTIRWTGGPGGGRTGRGGTRLDCPIFLSVGYAACHWCHVMAHESFEDPAIADAAQRGLLEQSRWTARNGPTSTSIYMAATQMMSGHGGWPMSVFSHARRTTIHRRHVLSPDRPPVTWASPDCSRR